MSLRGDGRVFFSTGIGSFYTSQAPVPNKDEGFRELHRFVLDRMKQ